MQHTGVVSNLQTSQRTSAASGNTYNVYTFNLDTVNTLFKDVYFNNKFRPENGQRIQLNVEGEGRSKKYEGQVVGGAGQAQTTSAPPASNSYGKSPDQQASIVRQFCVREAIALYGIRVQAGLIPKKLLQDDSSSISLIGNYAKIIHGAVKDEEGFNALEGFTGQVNEVGDFDDQLPEDMR